MSGVDRKPLIASVLMAIAFIGIWVIGHYTDRVVFSEPASAFRFLTLTTLPWIIQVFLSALSRHQFHFSDHGFELSMIAFFGLLTMLAQEEIKNSNLPNLILAVEATLVLVLVTLYINTRRPTKGALLPPGWRLLSYVLGVVAVETYILVSLLPHIKKWALSFS